MRLLIVRHGETEDNILRKVQGQTHGKLTQNGLQQAEKVALRLADEKIDIIISSDLLRALKTAEIISKYHKQTNLIIDKQLREGNFGELTGVSLDLFKDGKLFENKQGELVEDIFLRADKFLNDIIKKYSNQTVLIVTHRGIAKAIIAKLTGQTAKEIYKTTRLDNTSVTEFEIIDNKVELKFINCTKHL